MKRLLLAGALALAWTSIASAAGTYPSPHFNDVTIDGTINTLALPTSAFAGVSDTQTFTGKTISGSANTLTNIGNSSLVNTAVTVNGITCTLGSTCSITAPASGVTVGTTTITGGTSGNVEYNNAGILGEKAVTGSGSVVLSTSPSMTGTLTVDGIALSFPGSGNIVGTTDLQTLTNKSIDSGQLTGTVDPSLTPFTQSGTGAVSTTLQEKARQLVWIKDYGAVCDGSHDDTTAIQDAWNYAASVGKSVYLGGVGGQCRFSTLTAPTPTTGDFGNRAGFIGDGPGLTQLYWTGNSGCAITFSATFASNGDYNATLGDFTLAGLSATVGNGICLTNITRIYFNKIEFTQFNNDIYAVDSFNVGCYYCRFLTSTIGVNAGFASNSHPNTWSFIEPSFAGITQYGLDFLRPSNLFVSGSDCENNGTSGSTTAACIYINGNPAEGSQGLTLRGGYFQNNYGLADIVLDQDSLGAYGVHQIEGADFERANGTIYNQHNIYINNNGTGTTVLRVSGNGFSGFNDYVPSTSRKYIDETNPSTANYVINSGGNFFGSSVETPSGPWYNETAWAIWSPLLSCGSGSLTGSSATGQYKRITQKTVALQEQISITNNGTCAQLLETSLPAIANTASVGTWKDIANGPGGQCSIGASATNMSCSTGAGSYPLSCLTGTIWISQLYETQ